MNLVGVLLLARRGEEEAARVAYRSILKHNTNPRPDDGERLSAAMHVIGLSIGDLDADLVALRSGHKLAAEIRRLTDAAAEYEAFRQEHLKVLARPDHPEHVAALEQHNKLQALTGKPGQPKAELKRLVKMHPVAFGDTMTDLIR